MRTINDYYPLCEKMTPLLAERVEIRSDPPLVEILAAYPRLIFVVAHSTPLSWLPIPFILGREMARCGGGERRPMGVFHRVLHRVPLVRRGIRFLSQTEGASSAAELTEALQQGKCTDLVVLPEGHNSFFGKGNELRPFTSSRFVEIAVRANVPLFIVSHLGTEAWAMHVRGRYLLSILRRLSPKLHDAAKTAGGFCIPALPRRMATYRVACQLHTPNLSTGDLSSNRHEKQLQLEQEAATVRAIMQRLLDDLQDASFRQQASGVAPSGDDGLAA